MDVINFGPFAGAGDRGTLFVCLLWGVLSLSQRDGEQAYECKGYNSDNRFHEFFPLLILLKAGRRKERKSEFRRAFFGGYVARLCSVNVIWSSPRNESRD